MGSLVDRFATANSVIKLSSAKERKKKFQVPDRSLTHDRPHIAQLL